MGKILIKKHENARNIAIKRIRIGITLDSKKNPMMKL